MSVTLVVTSHDALARGAPSPLQLTFDQPRVVIGRGAHADVRLPARAVSDTHAVIRVEAGDLSITDEGSTNGTAVNGQALVRGRKKALRGGDRIAVPGFELVVEASLATPDPPDRTATVARRLLAEALAAVGGEASPPELVLQGSGRRAGQRWRLPPPPSRLTAGRGDVCEIVLDDVDCSRQHAEFARDHDAVFVRDLGSKNGIAVAGRRVTERRLRDGDEVQLGRSVLRFVDPTEELLRAFDGGADEPAAVLPPRVTAPPGAAPASVAPGPAVAARASRPGDAPAPTASEGGTASGTDPGAADAAALPGAPDGGAATAPSAPANVATRASRAPQAPRRRTGDWIVVVLAVIILGVSIAALVFLLRGAPPPTR